MLQDQSGSHGGGCKGGGLSTALYIERQERGLAIELRIICEQEDVILLYYFCKLINNQTIWTQQVEDEKTDTRQQTYRQGNGEREQENSKSMAAQEEEAELLYNKNQMRELSH